ncbi:MAG: histone-fold-containing protein [Piptocephalis tieghemiana]|nr:MAG: histone-fold-containing protein [Piptocephalis tieghemiana]
MSAPSTIEDHDLPKAILQRIIKAALPEGVLLQKDARSALSRSTTVFINYLAAEANDIAKKAGHKTIGKDDVLKAIQTLELQEFLPTMEAEYSEWKRIQDEKKAKKSQSRTSASSSSSSSVVNSTDKQTEGDDEEEEEDDEEEEREDEAMETEESLSSSSSPRSMAMKKDGKKKEGRQQDEDVEMAGAGSWEGGSDLSDPGTVTEDEAMSHGE